VELIGATNQDFAGATKEPVILPFEDRIRMTRLYEEVLTRLEEMAMITARTLKMGAGASYAVKFNPVAAEDKAEFAAVELLSNPQGLGCYDYFRGACFGTLSRQTDRKSKTCGGLE
jgi:hypothetical protein